MTTVTPQTARSRRPAPFLAASTDSRPAARVGLLAVVIAVLVAMVAAVLAFTTASASAAAGAENRVRASDGVAQVDVEPPQHESPGQQLGEASSYHQTTVATGVAANNVLDDSASELRAYGPYHRRQSPTQTPGEARAIGESSDLHGRAPRFDPHNPTVQAYDGPLPFQARVRSRSRPGMAGMGCPSRVLVSSADPRAHELAAALTEASAELIAVTPAQAATLLPTYETRMEAAAAGTGPVTRGLAEFVEALHGPDITEIFAVTEGGITGIGLLTTLGHVAAVTLVMRSDPEVVKTSV